MLGKMYIAVMFVSLFGLMCLWLWWTYCAVAEDPFIPVLHLYSNLAKVKIAREALKNAECGQEPGNIKSGEPQEGAEEAEALKVEIGKATAKAVAAGEKWVEEATEMIANGTIQATDEECRKYLAAVRENADAMVQCFDIILTVGTLSNTAVADSLQVAQFQAETLMEAATEALGEQFKDVTSACVEAVQYDLTDLVQDARKSLDQLIAKAAEKLEEKMKTIRSAVDTAGSYNDNAGVAIAVGKGIV